MGKRFAYRWDVAEKYVFSVVVVSVAAYFVLEVCSGVLEMCSSAGFCAGGVLECARVLDFVLEVCSGVLEVSSRYVDFAKPSTYSP